MTDKQRQWIGGNCGQCEHAKDMHEPNCKLYIPKTEKDMGHFCKCSSFVQKEPTCDNCGDYEVNHLDLNQEKNTGECVVCDSCKKYVKNVLFDDFLTEI